MRKILLIPTLFSASLAFAGSQIEITPLVGYNIADKSTNLPNYTIAGGELQYNGFNFPIKPEISFLYSIADYEDDFLNYVNNADTNVMRFALNGVYEFNKLGFFKPLVKAGAGYETMDSAYNGNNDGSGFIDAGLGAKIPFTDMIALKLESIYMVKYNDARYDSNIALLAGLNITLGSNSKNQTTQVDYDMDNDGIIDSMDECMSTPANTLVNDSGCAVVTNETKSTQEPKIVEEPIVTKHIDDDIDGDGIKDSIDKCMKTPLGTDVATNGCKIDADSDNDGIKDSIDKCMRTPEGTEVANNGCASQEYVVNDGIEDISESKSEIEKLTIRFGYKYSELTAQSEKNVNKLVSYLKANPSININITGHTDSIASHKYNEKLSLTRANTIKGILVDKGISSNRMTTVGMGETNPIATNMYEAGRAQNRRIEIEIVK